MKSKVFKYFGFIVLFALAGLLVCVLIPRRYDVLTLKNRTNIQFWTLSKGSKIAYTLIPAKRIRKPYPVIFLQGGPGGFISESTIASLAPLSEDGFDVYLYDQVGSGHSARLENIKEYTAERHIRDLEEIVKKTGAEKVILIGQSWGAILAVLFIADYPEKVEKVVFTGPGPIQPIHAELAKIKPPDSLNLKEPLFSNAQANKSVHNLRSKFMLKWALLSGCKLASDQEADAFQTLLNNSLNKAIVCDTSIEIQANGGAGFYAQVMTVRSFTELKDPRSDVANCTIPVLIMKGQCDNQKWGFTREYLELFQNHRLVVIPGAGHSISIEQPEIYIQTIRDFLLKSPTDEIAIPSRIP